MKAAIKQPHEDNPVIGRKRQDLHQLVDLFFQHYANDPEQLAKVMKLVVDAALDPGSENWHSIQGEDRNGKLRELTFPNFKN